VGGSPTKLTHEECLRPKTSRKLLQGLIGKNNRPEEKVEKRPTTHALKPQRRGNIGDKLLGQKVVRAPVCIVDIFRGWSVCASRRAETKRKRKPLADGYL